MDSLYPETAPRSRRKNHSRHRCLICSPFTVVWCSTCKKHLPVEAFSISKEKVYGRQSLCRACMNAAERKYYAKDPTAGTFKTKERLYGLAQAEYEAMHAAQGGRCAICGNEETAKSRGSDEIKMLSIDHDHATGKVRALLCSACNHMIGNARDDTDILLKAIAYLQEHQ